LSDRRLLPGLRLDFVCCILFLQSILAAHADRAVRTQNSIQVPDQNHRGGSTRPSFKTRAPGSSWKSLFEITSDQVRKGDQFAI